VNRKILVVLLGNKERGETNCYQLLQEEVALLEAQRAGLEAQVVFAPGFDHVRLIRQRLEQESGPRIDAVLVEPSTTAALEQLLRELQGRVGLVVLNAWAPSIERYAAKWGNGLAFGSVSTDHSQIGQVQGRQILSCLPQGGAVVCITGPLRSPAAQQRLDGVRRVLPPEVTLYDTEAGQWTEAEGIAAFNAWYALYRGRKIDIGVIAAQNDELAVGAQAACRAVPDPEHRQVLLSAKLLGVDACPRFGHKLVEEGRLNASITTPASAGDAVVHLSSFWTLGTPVPMRAFTVSQPHPPGSVA
jgi:ABC-type sugar transport system substrate-binding protein